MKGIFEFFDFRQYLKERLGREGERTGMRGRACRAIGCHSTYLSQVLSAKLDLSPDFAEGLNLFLRHNEDEAHYFLTLVLLDRAKTPQLKQRLNSRLHEMRTKRRQIKSRIGKSFEIPEEDRNHFYSHWIYAAIHALVSIPRFQSLEALSIALAVPKQELKQALDFLGRIRLIRKEGDRFMPDIMNVHLGQDSHLISQHHTNWRIHVIQSLARKKPDDLHYSGVFSMSMELAQTIREDLLKNLERHIEWVKPSPAESAYAFTVDFYSLG